MVDTNVTAVAVLTKVFGAGMVQRNRGHIINISSVAAHHAYPGTLLNSAVRCISSVQKQDAFKQKVACGHHVCSACGEEF